MQIKLIPILVVMQLITNSSYAQTDTISENFNNICELTSTPGRTYAIEYTGENEINWSIKTLYSSSSWWGGLNDDGSHIDGTIHCGSLQWDESNSGYARAILPNGISSLSFQMVYGFQLVGGYVKIMINGIEIGRTEILADTEVHTYDFPVNAAGSLDLELIPVVESSIPGGIIVDNLTIIESDLETPFFSVEKLDDFDPWMDTLSSSSESVHLHLFAEHCLYVNGEYVEYFDLADDVDLTIGSVIDLIPGDSINLFYNGTVLPGVGHTTGKSAFDLYFPANISTNSIEYDTSEGMDTLNGVVSFINGNIDLDLVIFKISDLKNEYHINYNFESFKPEPIDTVATGLEKRIQNPISAVKLYPNPIQNHAYFETSKNLDYFELFDMHGKRIFIERNPQLTGDGHYKLDIESLDIGLSIIRFTYKDNTFDALKVMVQ